MANQLDELTGPVNEEGRDVNVIHKQIPITVGGGSKFFDIVWWFLPPIIGGVIWLFIKMQADNYLRQLEQKLQKDASTIDNYLEQRVVVLQNAAKLLDKAINLDKETFTNIALARGGRLTDEERNSTSLELDKIQNAINVAFESYPNLEAHNEIANVMQQNDYLQREISAARDLYNDTVYTWNHAVNSWPTKMIVAAKKGYTTRIPFTTTTEVKQKARDVFF